MNRHTHAVLASLVVALLASCGSSTETDTLRLSTTEGDFDVTKCDGNTKGFWSNKNGQELIGQADVDDLRTEFELRNDGGAEFNPMEKADLVDFLRGANASDMANQLSAQWIAFFLSARHTLCEEARFHFPEFSTEDEELVSYEALEAAVIEALEENDDREWMETLKNFLDGVNNDAQACVCEPPTGGGNGTVTGAM